MATPKSGAPDCNNYHEGKRGSLFSIDQKLKNMTNCEHVIIKPVVSLFFQLNFNKLNPISIGTQDCRNYVCNISGTFQEMIVQRRCRKNNVAGVYFTREILPLFVLSPSLPAPRRGLTVRSIVTKWVIKSSSYFNVIDMAC